MSANASMNANADAPLHSWKPSFKQQTLTLTAVTALARYHTNEPTKTVLSSPDDYISTKWLPTQQRDRDTEYLNKTRKTPT